VIRGCYQVTSGTLRVTGTNPTVGGGKCSANENALPWNQTGPKGDPGANGTNGTNGTNGVSPTVAQEPPGANCAAGGVAITDAANTTAYVCNGQAGADGQPFSGTFTSPNGEYSISVTNAGVTVARGGGPFITLSGDDITVKSSGTATVEAGTNLTLKATNNASLKASGTTTVQGGGVLSLDGSTVNINDSGSCHFAARMGDMAVGAAPDGGGAVISTIFTGTPTVCIG
jgi:hypothetical protein